MYTLLYPRVVVVGTSSWDVKDRFSAKDASKVGQGSGHGGELAGGIEMGNIRESRLR